MTPMDILVLTFASSAKTSVAEDAHAVPKLMLSYFLISRSRLDLRAALVEMSFTGRYYQLTMSYRIGCYWVRLWCFHQWTASGQSRLK